MPARTRRPVRRSAAISGARNDSSPMIAAGASAAIAAASCARRLRRAGPRPRRRAPGATRCPVIARRTATIDHSNGQPGGQHETETPIRFGILGSGNMARVYGDALATQVPGGRLTAIALGTRAAALAAEFGVAAEAVGREPRRPAPTSTSSSSPRRIRPTCRWPSLSAAAGKHVYLEKPMALDVAECDQIIDACRRAGVQLTIAKQTRHMEMSMRAKAFVDEGRIGEILFLRPMSVTPGAGFANVPQSWPSDPREGDAFLDWGAHACDAHPLVHRRRAGPRLRRLRQLHRPAAREPDGDGPVPAVEPGDRPGPAVATRSARPGSGRGATTSTRSSARRARSSGTSTGSSCITGDRDVPDLGAAELDTPRLQATRPAPDRQHRPPDRRLHRDDPDRRRRRRSPARTAGPRSR